MDAQATVHAYWQAANERRWDDFGALHTLDVVYEVPQTRERVRGRAAYVDFNRTFPGEWQVVVQQVLSQGQQAVSVTQFCVGTERMTGICFSEFTDGLISRLTDYWPSPYEPPQRASPFVERYENL